MAQLFLVVLPWGFVAIANVGMRIEATEIWFVGIMLTKLYLTPPRALFGLPSPGPTKSQAARCGILVAHGK